MQLQYIPYVVPLALSAVIAAVLTLVALRRHQVRSAFPFALLTLGIFEWSVGYGLELTCADLPVQVFWAKVEYFGIVSVPLTWFAFALIYTGREHWFTLRRLLLFSVVPLTTLILVWTNDWHGLVWSQTAARSFESASILSPSYGAWFWIHTTYSYVLILVGSILFLQTLSRAPNLQRGQAAVLIVSALAPWIGNAIYLLRISPFSYFDLTPFAFTVSGVALAWDMVRYQLLDLVPVARDLVVESMDDAVLVLDARNRIVDLNPAAEQLIGRSAAEVTGTPIQLILSAWSDLVERYVDVPNAHDEMPLGEGTDQEWFDFRISPVSDRRGNLTGRLLVLRDITRYKRTEEALRETRDELEMRVQARTRDLATANEQLLARIVVRKRAEEEIRQRAQRQETLYHVSQELGNLSTPRELCETVARAARDNLGYPFVGVFLLDPQTGERVLQADSGFGGAPIGWRLGPGEGVTEEAILSGKLQYWPNVVEQSRFRPGVEGAAAEVDVPIKVGDRVMGVLVTEEKQIDPFDVGDFGVLQALANQLAVALENTRLLDELKQSLAISTRLYELSSQILTASTTEETAQLVTETLRASFHADAASIQIIDADAQVESYHSDGLSLTFHQITTLRPNGMTMTAWKSGAPVIVNDPLKLHPLLREEGIQASIALPLRGDPINLGVVFLNYRRQHTFSPREIELLSLFANQAALALKRVRLVEETRRRALEQSTLSQVARALNAELDVRVAFPSVVASLRQLTHCDHASITLLDTDNREYTLVALDEPRMEWKPGDRVAATASNATANLLAGQAHFSNDLSTEQELPLEQTLYLEGVRSRVVLPLMVGTTVLGGLELTSTRPNAFDGAQVPLLQQIANAVAISVENSRLFDAEQTRRAELTALYDLSRALADAPPDSDSLLELVARHAVETIHVTFARAIMREENELVVRVAYPRRVLDRELGIGNRAPVSSYPFCQRVMESNDPEVVCADKPDITPEEYDALFLGMCQSICIVPLRTDGRNLGLIVLGEERSEEREPFTPEKIRLARSIGDQASSALHRVELFDEVERAYLETVFSLANAVEAKDSYTADHVQNVARMALDIGRAMGLSQHELAALRFGAVLHDIGKIGIPDAVLKKPGTLDAEEWEIMRQHPVIGERILAPIEHLREAAQIVRHHHERYDGSGYPDRLVGEAIPLGARILTVVDSYSAIIDRRIYKAARSHDQALAELSRCAGTQFDPNVVNLFLKQETRPIEKQLEPAQLV